MKISTGRRRKGLLFPQQSASERDEHLDSQQWRDHKYDERTGQIFTETTLRILGSRDGAWTRRTRVLYERSDTEDEKNRKEAKTWDARRLGRVEFSNRNVVIARLGAREGSRTLQSTALEQVIQNISDLTIHSFEYLPITLVKRIWDIARKRCSISFATWALFSRILYNEDYISEDLLQYAEAFSSPQLSLDLYTKPLTSLSFDFITSLCITTPFPVPDLVKLSRVVNLGILEIINTDMSSAGRASLCVSDRLVRGWHLAATIEGAFQLLRILRLWNHEELTVKSLPYLNGFPSLAVYDVSGCTFNKEAKLVAKNLGWKMRHETNVLKTLEATCVKRVEELRRRNNSDQNLPANLVLSNDDIRRIPKSDINAFLTRIPPQQPIAPAFTLKSEPGFPRRAQNVEISKIVPRQKELYLRRSQKLDAWEANAYKTYARIGELRNESDFERAGVPILEYVVKGCELQNPIPMVLVRLGKSVSSLMLTRTPSSNAQSFFRIQATADGLRGQGGSYGGTGDVSSRLAQELGAAPEDDLLPTPSQIPSKEVQTVQRNKKRRLDDVLNSFL